MSNEVKSGNRRVSRRDFLNIAAAGSGAIIAVGSTNSASAAPKKFSRQQAHYQPVPKSGQRCQNCACGRRRALVRWSKGR